VEYLGEPKWHPLACHALDVAAIAGVWWEDNSTIRQSFTHAFDGDEVVVRAWVLFFIALHDIGKLDLRFQRKADEALKKAWPDIQWGDIDKSQSKAFDHGRHGFGWILKECGFWLGVEIANENQDDWRLWAAAVTGHHGDIPHFSDIGGEYAEAYLMEHDRDARQEWVAGMARLFLEPSGQRLNSLLPACPPPAQALLAGFCSICDWIASNSEVSPYIALYPGFNLEAYYAQRVSEVKNRGYLTQFGLIRKAGSYQGLAVLLNHNKKETPRGVQVRVDDLPCEPGLTLIEAPTGSGKTEAALAYAWRLLAGGVADSIIFALPTQATANAMLKRAEVFAGIAYQENGSNIVLAHGKRQFNADFEKLIQSNRSFSREQEAAAQCAAWLAQSRKRVFLGQVGICTVDQALLSVLPVRHKFVRGFGLNKSVLIVDEVHAYDAYMHGLLGEVLRRQKATGGSAILLSATLPNILREKIFRAWGADIPKDDPYPVIWHALEKKTSFFTLPDNQKPLRREITMQCIPLPKAMPDDGLLDRVAKAAEAGARVAVIVNLVDTAQGIARRLQTITTIPVDIFHARYRFADRQIREKKTVEQYSRDAVRSSGRILVATQVVEQSLDLDFDWMLTQICPVDLLFQRLGRLHRHERDRPPGFHAPQCTVITAADQDYGPIIFIYKNVRALWRTEQLLSSTAQLVFPEAYRDWIEKVYQDEAWDSEPETIRSSYEAYSLEEEAAEYKARQMISMPRQALFGDDDAAIAISTRDGEMSRIILAKCDDGSLLGGEKVCVLSEQEKAVAIEVNTIPVPCSWKACLEGITVDEDGRYPLIFKREPGGWTAESESALFRYSTEYGLERRKKDGSAH